MKELKLRLDSLCIFRELLQDKVISALYKYMEHPTNSAYAEFVAALYISNGGDLGKHIKTITENSENVYVRLKGMGRDISPFMEKALTEELNTLQQIADVTPEQLQNNLEDSRILPEFVGGNTDIADNYRHRAANISKYGYGIYAENRMFYVDTKGDICPVNNPDKTRLADLVDYKREQKIVIDNTKSLLCGRPAANILLTGDAGTGKSSTVKAVVNELYEDGLRIIEIRKDQLQSIPRILDTLAENPLKFILFIDDLSFLKDDDNFNALKAVLEGSVSARSQNVVIYATSNRRHIIKEKFSDREGDDIHRNETLQELISLSERFGLHITFSKPDKKTYLNIVSTLAKRSGIETDKEKLELLAERFALERGGRSARLARQFVDGLIGKEV